MHDTENLCEEEFLRRNSLSSKVNQGESIPFQIIIQDSNSLIEAQIMGYGAQV